jgi:GTP-binding protein EngB required for normal cell division
VLRENELPQDYKVAVIGRFKAGKSSFVNELLGRKLAGEDTSPETAAVTTFRYGERVLAKITADFD